MEHGFVYDTMTPGNAHITTNIAEDIMMQQENGPRTYVSAGLIFLGYPMSQYNNIDITPYSIRGTYDGSPSFSLDESGVRLKDGDDNHVLTSHGSTIDITQYALKTELPTVPTNVSQLTNDSNFIT
jgi:hypothetical protein